MVKVSFVRENKTVAAGEGENLLALMQKAGIAVDAPCGGRGKCGKCRVKLADGETVLACQTTVLSDLQVDTDESRLLSRSARILEDAFIDGGETDGGKKDVGDPHLRQIRITLPPCPSGKSISDWTRFARAVKEVLPEVDLIPDPAVADVLGPLAKEAGRQLYVLVFQDRVLRVDSKPFAYYTAAFDIGTTTVAAYLQNGADGSEAARASCLNPQARYGADVIGRANYTLENAMEPVSSCIRKAVNELLGTMAEQAGIRPQDIYLLAMAGNTCMHHLFLGICVDSLVHAPYNPAVSEAMVLRAADYGLQVNPDARMLMLPNIAGFVGADTVACLVASRLAEQQDWTLLIDIGTNGEMVLGRQHQMAACSTAAGPAFEGAGISCGMRGVEGAISEVRWEDDHWETKVIGDGRPAGMCGSGLLDLVAQLLTSGQMDEYGELQEGDRIVLAAPGESADGQEVSLLQKDIRQLQLAKAAIATGVRLLAKKLDVGLEQISKVWLAGAFGSFLSPDSACAIGLIPPELAGRITPIGNAAGEGARKVVNSTSAWAYAKQLATETSFLELASMKEFNDCYMDELVFPEQEE